jgi:UDP-glucose 4-epimerase
MAEVNVIENDTIPKNWLITGGCGFIGTSLILYLRETRPDVRIRVLDNLSVGTLEDLAAVCDFSEIKRDGSDLGPEAEAWEHPLQLVVGDIRDFGAALACASGMDVIVHLAANTGVAPSVEDPRADMESNVVGTFNMLEAARQQGVSRFVFASSGAPIGEVEPPIHEELAPHPVSPYGASKLAGEGYCSAYSRSFGLDTVALRFGNVYGPGSGHKNSVVAKFIKQALNGETLEIYGDGQQTRDFIYIDDLSRAIQLAATKGGVGGHAFQIATHAETTVSEIVDRLRDVFDNNSRPFPEVTHTAPRIGDVKRNFSDTSKAKAMLAWSAETDLADGLGITLRWFMGRD